MILNKHKYMMYLSLYKVNDCFTEVFKVVYISTGLSLSYSNMAPGVTPHALNT